jgi:hypothetical protein
MSEPRRIAEPERWQTVVPVPVLASAPTFTHIHYSAADIDHTATYAIDANVYGYVVRFRKSDGGKAPLPYTWCRSLRDGTMRWHWRQWDEPRPLYLAAHALRSDSTVVVVEGEKKADLLQAVLDRAAPAAYLVVCWPGGALTWRKADWSWLDTSAVLLWPDCDGKREQPTPTERKACGDDAALAALRLSKPLLPAHKQVGMKAMLDLGALLRDEHGCTVRLLPIPEPGAAVDGWDCADAIIGDGWDDARVLAFLDQALALPPRLAEGGGRGGARPALVDLPDDSPDDAPADDDDGVDAFAAYLAFMCEALKCGVYAIPVSRKLIITALRKAPALQGCLGFNDLTGTPCVCAPWPWRDEVGTLRTNDDLRLGDFLSVRYKLKAVSRAALAEAMATVADQYHFHPIRDWLATLQWDGQPRLDSWLMQVLGLEPELLAPKRGRYLALVGRFLLLGLVARVMEPGCKFDYSPVFEGPTGLGKSSLIKLLVGSEFFSDTHFEMGQGKDGYEQLDGIWGYELSELTPLRRADSEQVKQFISSTVDRFRSAYGHFVEGHLRQCVIFCSTNQSDYLHDPGGNRRFWPVPVDRPINRYWLGLWRPQLFAEAYAAYLAGERYTPTLDEEAELFAPEQKLRLAETAVQSRLYELLTREGASSGDGRLTMELTCLTRFVTLNGLVSALGADASKSTRLLENQICAWLREFGWVVGRENTGPRRRGYLRPKVWPPKIEDEAGAQSPAAEGVDRDSPAAAPGGVDDDAV